MKVKYYLISENEITVFSLGSLYKLPNLPYEHFVIDQKSITCVWSQFVIEYWSFEYYYA